MGIEKGPSRKDKPTPDDRGRGVLPEGFGNASPDVGRFPYQEKASLPETAATQKLARKIVITSTACELIDEIVKGTDMLSARQKRDRLLGIATLQREAGLVPAYDVLEESALITALGMPSPEQQASGLVTAGVVRFRTDAAGAKEIFEDVVSMGDNHSDEEKKADIYATAAHGFAKVGDFDRVRTLIDENIAPIDPQQALVTVIEIAERESEKKEHADMSIIRLAHERLLRLDERLSEDVSGDDASAGVDAAFFRVLSGHDSLLGKVAKMHVAVSDYPSAALVAAKIETVSEKHSALTGLARGYASSGEIDNARAVIIQAGTVGDPESLSSRQAEALNERIVRIVGATLAARGNYEDAYSLLESVNQKKQAALIKRIFTYLPKGSIEHFDKAVTVLNSRENPIEKAALLATLSESSKNSGSSDIQEKLGQTATEIASELTAVSFSSEKAAAIIHLAQVEGDMGGGHGELLAQAESLDLISVQDNKDNLVWAELAKAQAKAGNVIAAFASFSQISPRYYHNKWESFIKNLPLDEEVVHRYIFPFVTTHENPGSSGLLESVAKEQNRQGLDTSETLSLLRERANSVQTPEAKYAALAAVAKVYLSQGISVSDIHDLDERALRSLRNSDVQGITPALKKFLPHNS